MIICHRINSIEKLKTIPEKYGVEIDVRHNNRTGGLYLNHDPSDGEDIEEYLKHFKHAFIIFNIKEAGTEKQCVDLAKKYEISKEKYFLLDVEFPFIYRATREGMREIAIRYSEDEVIEQALKYKGKADWVWMDTNTVLPLDEIVADKLKGFKTCLVCPERWGRPQDIPIYIEQMKKLNFKLDAVMTAVQYAKQWEESGVVIE